jgi:hypothetical protein
LRAWVRSWDIERKEGVATCPSCRTGIWTTVDELRGVLKSIVRELVAYLRSDPDLDWEVDAYLLNFNEQDLDECADVSFGVMLEKLNRRSACITAQTNVRGRLVRGLTPSTQF